MLSNAVKFTDREFVKINSQLADNNSQLAQISGEDTGIGIKEQDLDKLFKPFQRIESPVKAKIPGTGLGLYLTKKIVTEILKGDIILNE